MQGTRIINPKLCKRRKCRYYTNGGCILAQYYRCSNREVLWNRRCLEVGE